MLRPFTLLLLISVSAICGLKILVYSPRLGTSHVNFLGRISDILIEEGHQVTVVLPIVGDRAPKNGTKRAKCIVVEPGAGCGGVDLDADIWGEHETTFYEKYLLMNKVVEAHECACRNTLKQEALLNELRKEEFDLGISEMFDICGIPFFHDINIKKHVVVTSMMLPEFIGSRFGNPNILSVVPASLGELSNKMSFVQRIANLIDVWISVNFLEKSTKSVQKVIDEKYGRRVVDVDEKIKEATFVITNVDPILDFPSPTTERIVNIGGISVPEPKELDSFWEKVVTMRKITVLFSFGTVAKAYTMPERMKKAVLEAFARFPEVTFIWKYEKDEDRVAEGVANVVTNKWVPQNDLLAHPNLKLFITHSGLASTLETSARGVPMLCFPLFGDQQRNARMVEALGTSRSSPRGVLLNPDEFERQIRELLENPSYQEHAKRIAKMIKMRPRDQRKALVKHIAFAAEFGSLPEKHVPELHFLQYYLIDIAVVVFFAVSLPAWFIYRLFVGWVRSATRKEKTS